MTQKVEHITERYLEGNTETDVFDYWKAMNATTIPEIEDAMIAPLYGFSDKFGKCFSIHIDRISAFISFL